MNTDAGCLSNGQVGQWQMGFMQLLPTMNILEAEMRSILTGLTLLHQVNVKHIMIETDSMEAVNIIQHPIPSYHPLLTVRNRCMKVMIGFEESQAQHVYREANQAAHLMATLAKTVNPGLHVFYDPPEQLCNTLVRDAVLPMYYDFE